MAIQIDFNDSSLLSLQDAIAYEFFMDNVQVCIGENTDSTDETAFKIAELAQLSYSIANLFILARTKNENKYHKETNGAV